MCFIRTKESKVLVAKRGIKVYKIGADTFIPFFYSNFDYPVNQLVVEPVIFADSIEYGLHSYLNCIPTISSCRRFIYSRKSSPLYPAAAFCFGQDFLVHYPSENMVVVGNKFDKEK